MMVGLRYSGNRAVRSCGRSPVPSFCCILLWADNNNLCLALRQIPDLPQKEKRKVSRTIKHHKWENYLAIVFHLSLSKCFPCAYKALSVLFPHWKQHNSQDLIEGGMFSKQTILAQGHPACLSIQERRQPSLGNLFIQLPLIIKRELLCKPSLLMARFSSETSRLLPHVKHK